MSEIVLNIIASLIVGSVIVAFVLLWIVQRMATKRDRGQELGEALFRQEEE